VVEQEPQTKIRSLALPGSDPGVPLVALAVHPAASPWSAGSA
jgi:hypothetical protein